MKIIDEILKVAGEQRKEVQEMLKNPDIELSSPKKKFVSDALQEIDQLTGVLKDMQQMFNNIDNKVTWQKINLGKGTEAWGLKLQDAQFFVALERLQRNSYRVSIREIVHYKAEKKFIEKIFRQKGKAENYVQQYMKSILAEHKDIIDKEEFFTGTINLLLNKTTNEKI
ncbi:MAG: hypothetical protein QMD10_11830 [Desulfitobacteriaceae bacterium]|nr:hypothetical protein [Desulfitobacteriaceae bacterium]